ncbi:MAG: virulence RhuM family protein [Lachnospiraceae bacterium]|nr:virulence RhuM family protein [Lachnospiraceae bacterium]
MTNEKEIVLFETEDKKVLLPVEVKDETVWLNRNQMAELFDRDVKTIGKHVNNALKEELRDEDSVVAFFATTASDGKTYQMEYYNLDIIISVGYRVKSNRGVEFRRWANSVLKQYILQGYAVNQKRIQQLGEVIRIMKRTENELDSKQILSVIERYNNAYLTLSFIQYTYIIIAKKRKNIKLENQEIIFFLKLISSMFTAGREDAGMFC